MLSAAPAGALAADFEVQVDNPAQWEAVLSSVGLYSTSQPARFQIAVGDAPAARAAGVCPTGATTRVVSVVDERAPNLQIVWETPLDVPVYELPAEAQIFVREKWTGAPLLAGFRRDQDVLLWAAVAPGPRGYDRFPYLLHALVDLGLVLPFHGARTWAFFDYSYRTRVDLDYMARHWRQTGLASLHVSAWHFQEPNEERDRYLEALIEACHREGVLVYAWLELPHVSERFWEQHPDCREKTASLQNAQLDWRKLINLADPACGQPATTGVLRLLQRFDWDGVNLAELYFESLHGPANPQRFTPMNRWVRADFRRQAGVDPLTLFDETSPFFWSRNAEQWSRFVDYRADLALRLQTVLLKAIRRAVPQLDVVVTQIDDRFEPHMREFLGADAAALLPLAEPLDFSLVVEDPATLWNLGPERYLEIAERYRPLASDPRRLAIDINIVDRYQQVYPTKKQVGTELFQLVRLAGQAFSRVMLYAEHSISRPDRSLLRFAAATVKAERSGGPLVVESARPFGVTWPGPLQVDGRDWPVSDGEVAWLPAGRHRLEPAREWPSPCLLYLNADLIDARPTSAGLTFEYQSSSCAIALLERAPTELEVDGQPSAPNTLKGKGHWAVLLPSGRHQVRIR